MFIIRPPTTRHHRFKLVLPTSIDPADCVAAIAIFLSPLASAERSALRFDVNIKEFRAWNGSAVRVRGFAEVARGPAVYQRVDLPQFRATKSFSLVLGGTEPGTEPLAGSDMG
jgi:hypothetical protein